MRGYLGGFFDSKFQPKIRNKGCRSNSFDKPVLATIATTKHQEPQQQLGSALMPNQGEAFEIPVNDGQFVTHQNSTDIEHEVVQPTQEELLQQLNTIVTQIDTEKVFVDDALRSQLEPIQHPLETLSDLAKPRTSRPKYL